MCNGRPKPQLDYWGGKCSEPQSASEHATSTSRQNWVQIQYLNPSRLKLRITLQVIICNSRSTWRYRFWYDLPTPAGSEASYCSLVRDFAQWTQRGYLLVKSHHQLATMQHSCHRAANVHSKSEDHWSNEKSCLLDLPIWMAFATKPLLMASNSKSACETIVSISCSHSMDDLVFGQWSIKISTTSSYWDIPSLASPMS